MERVDGRAWLVTPCGERFFSLGVNVINPSARDPSMQRDPDSQAPVDEKLAAWIAEARERVTQWNFNSAGGWSLTPNLLKMPEVVNLELGRNSKFHWFDPFDPAMPEIMRAKAKQLTAPYRGSPYRIGYFSDNEVGWWAGALFSFYAMKPASNYTKQRWVQMLRDDYHGDWRRFTADFLPPEGVRSWKDLLSASEITHLKPGGHGIVEVRHWTAVVAGHYYRLSRDAIRDADPGALFLGDRLPIYYDPAAVRAEAPYVDMVATNYNVDSPEGWIAPYFFAGLHALSGGKPVLVTEWFYAAKENRTGNTNNGHLMTVATQAERAEGAAAATVNYAALPDVVGMHWFQYYDDPKGGRADGEDYDFGLVDMMNQPYNRLVAALAAANHAAPAVHATAVPESAARQPLLPRAVIDPAHGSFIDWPKPQSLLPPMIASPHEVAFGEAYLSWSRMAWRSAPSARTITTSGCSPMTATSRWARPIASSSSVDAGAGPRHFTYYFIPPRTKVKDHPPMAPKLCMGTPAEHGATDCPPVPGAQALYFGADQPRIAAEALIPWSALGLMGPPSLGHPQGGGLLHRLAPRALDVALGNVPRRGRQAPGALDGNAAGRAEYRVLAVSYQLSEARSDS